MHNSSLLLGFLTLTALTVACASREPLKQPPPHFEELFDSGTLSDEATPNEMFGIFETETTDTATGATTTTRVMYWTDYAVGAVRCTPADKSAAPVLAGGSTDIRASSLDRPMGSVTVGAMNFSNGACAMNLAAGTYTYEVHGLDLILTLPAGGTMKLKKISD